MQHSTDHDHDNLEDHWGFGSARRNEDDVSTLAAVSTRRTDSHPYRDPRHGLLARRRRLAKELEELERLRVRAEHVREHLGLVDALLAAQEVQSSGPSRWRARDALPLALRSVAVLGTGAALGLLVALVLPWRSAHERAQEAAIERLEAELAIASSVAPTPAPAAEPVRAVAAPRVTPVASAPRPWPVRDLEAIFDHHVARLDADTFEVERGYVQELIHTSSTASHRMRVMAHSEHGRVVGVRIYGVHVDSIVGRLGLRNGDTLIAVNGMEMASSDSVLRAYTSLRQADVLALLIERRGRRQILVYHLVDQLSRSIPLTR